MFPATGQAHRHANKGWAPDPAHRRARRIFRFNIFGIDYRYGHRCSGKAKRWFWLLSPPHSYVTSSTFRCTAVLAKPIRQPNVNINGRLFGWVFIVFFYGLIGEITKWAIGLMAVWRSARACSS
jgi:hypothetical protein